MMEKENLDIYNLVENELIREGIWFTQKSDPTYQNAKSYYKLDKYGDPEEKTKNQIAEEVKSLIGDGAVDIPDAIELWKNDQMMEARLDFKSNLVTTFEPKPVVDGIEAFENPVQLSESKSLKTENKVFNALNELNASNFVELKDEVEKLYSDGIVTDDQYDSFMYIIEKQEEQCYDYIDRRAKVTNTDDRDIDYIESDYVVSTLQMLIEEVADLDESKKVESKTKKTEGPGAGYNIGGTLKDVNVISFNIDKDYLENNEHFGNLPERYFVLNCDIEANVEDCEFASYGYGSKLDFPTEVKITNLTLIDQNYDEGDDEHTEVDKDNIEEALDGATFNEVIGGGYVHTTFSGSFEAALDGSVYSDLYADNCDIEFLNAEVVNFIDKKVSGNLDDTTYCVLDADNSAIDDFENEDDAIKFAEENGYAEVVEKYHDYALISADGSIDDNSYEDGDIVWKRDAEEVEESKKVKTEASDYDYDAYMKEQEELKKQYKDRIMKSATPEIINAFNDLNDLLNNGGNVIALDGFYFPEKAITVVELADKNYHLNPSMDLTTSNILNMVGNNDTFEQAIDELFADYDANSAYSWADNFVTVLSKLDFDIQDADDEEFKECKKVENFVNDDGIEIVDDKESGFTYAKIFVDFFVADKDNAEEEVNKFLDKYTTELGGRTETLKSMLEYLDNWNYHTYVDILEKKLKDSELLECNVNFNKRTKDKKIEAITDNFYSAFDSHGFRRRIDKDTTIEELMDELHNFIEFENISKDDTRKAIKDIVSHLNMQLKANLDELSIYLWYINGNYGGTYEKVRKNKITENYQKRLQEVNNKSANLIADAMQADGFDAESDAGKILVRTQQLFTALSDKGLDVDVTLDNGESTSVIQLGTAGGKIVITITNTDKPLQAFISGNVEINDDILKEFQQVKDCIKTV